MVLARLWNERDEGNLGRGVGGVKGTIKGCGSRREQKHGELRPCSSRRPAGERGGQVMGAWGKNRAWEGAAWQGLWCGMKPWPKLQAELKEGRKEDPSLIPLPVVHTGQTQDNKKAWEERENSLEVGKLRPLGQGWGGDVDWLAQTTRGSLRLPVPSICLLVCDGEKGHVGQGSPCDFWISTNPPNTD